MLPGIQGTLTRIESDTNKANWERGRANMGSDKLDKQAFLQLLMAKLKFQDPMNPTEDADFMQQQAQLAQVEKLDDLVKLLQGNSLLSQASTLVGKKVDIFQPDNKRTITGVIDSASFSNGTAGIHINGKTYTMAQITKIYSDAPASP